MCKRQRGVAVITALLLTTLSITIVASLFWQQQVQVRSIENQRLQLQKQWILRGALDWAALILRADVASTGDAHDHLDEPWAVPLAETRLDDYVENGRVEGEASDATLSGSIVDAQSRYNIANLAENGVINPAEERAFAQLLSSLQLNPNLARAAAVTIAATQSKVVSQSGAAQATQPSDLRSLPFSYLDDLLTVPGFTPEIIEKLRDHAIVLPAAVKQINVNTASAEVLAAKIDTLSLAGAKALIESRRTAYFRTIFEFREKLTTIGGVSADQGNLPDDNKIWFRTNYFLVNGKVSMSRAGLEVQALMRRQGQTSPKVIWIREN